MKMRAILTGLCSFLLGCGTIMQATGFDPDQAKQAFATGAVKAAAAQLPIGLEEERAYGGAIAVKIVQKYGGLDENPRHVHYLMRVGQAVAAFSARPELEYHFAVLNSDAVQALSAPGGYVFVTRGALKKMQNEAQLAGVLAHEVAHITAKHALGIIQNVKSRQAMTDAAADAWKGAAAFNEVIGKFLDDYLEQGLPQDTEFAADKLGTDLLARVGWAPAGLRDFLQILATDEANAPGDAFYKTHPKTADRVEKLTAQVTTLGGGVSNDVRFHAAIQ
jgi:predicted Zn-dependent protease